MKVQIRSQQTILILAVLLGANAAPAQVPPGSTGGAGGAQVPSVPPPVAYGGGTPNASLLLRTPVTSVFPGNQSLAPKIEPPQGNQAEAAMRGMQYFTSMNCVGCHAPNGGGGMGPALSNRSFIYGSEPAQIYLSIYQGRPRGMPAWGEMLPSNVIWDLVAYVKNLSQAPSNEWGMTISASTKLIEQVPAEYTSTANPWSETQPFSYGQKPSKSR